MDPDAIKDNALLNIGVVGLIAIVLIREVFSYIAKRNGKGSTSDPRINWYHEFRELRDAQAGILQAIQVNQTELIKTLSKLEVTLSEFDPTVKPRDVMAEVTENRKLMKEVLSKLDG